MRDKNETKVGKQSANLGKNNEPIKNRLSFLIDCKSVILHHLTILSFPMVRPAWDNWWLLAYLIITMLTLAVLHLMRTMLNANRPTGVPLRLLFLLAATLLPQRVCWGHSLFFVNPLYMGQLPFLGWHVYGCLIWVLARNTNVIQMRSAYSYVNGFLCARKLAQ